jgi:hypothetical protein
MQSDLAPSYASFASGGKSAGNLIGLAANLLLPLAPNDLLALVPCLRRRRQLFLQDTCLMLCVMKQLACWGYSAETAPSQAQGNIAIRNLLVLGMSAIAFAAYPIFRRPCAPMSRPKAALLSYTAGNPTLETAGYKKGIHVML